jgi:hypothetical protein
LARDAALAADLNTDPAGIVTNAQFQRQLARMEESIHVLNDAADSPTSRESRELVEVLLEMYANAFERMLDLIHDTTSQSFASKPILAE